MISESNKIILELENPSLVTTYNTRPYYIRPQH